jgi:hypothetical protein
MAQRVDEVESQVGALQLQQTQGWSVGGAPQLLTFDGSSVTDISGQTGWRNSMVTLANRMLPQQPAYLPYYVPTLFQSLSGGSGLDLRARMRPVHTDEMDHDFARGVALAATFQQAGWPTDTAVVIDAPGPRAVAVAAGLAERFDPIFTFGNWPHPLGVVPAHQTLGAMLYYLPLFERARQMRPTPAAPVWVLDSNRLQPYIDADRQFDNRYFVQMPSAEQLNALGIRHILYVSAQDGVERDDLNHDFCDLAGKGVDVKMIALSDFMRADSAIAENNLPLPLPLPLPEEPWRQGPFDPLLLPDPEEHEDPDFGTVDL